MALEVERAKFELGQIVMTRGIEAKFDGDQDALGTYLRRHHAGDWGDLDPHDAQMNEDALVGEKDRIMSVYELPEERGSGKMYIITEWDRSVTTFLLPEEY